MTKPLNVWLCQPCAISEGEFHRLENRYSYPAGGYCGGCQKHVPGRTEWFGTVDEWRGPLVELPKVKPPVTTFEW